jgi:hypothetical protein
MDWKTAVGQSDGMVIVARAVASGALDGVIHTMTDEMRQSFASIAGPDADVMCEAGADVLTRQRNRIYKAGKLQTLHERIVNIAEAIKEDLNNFPDDSGDYSQYEDETELTVDFDKADEAEYEEELDADYFDSGNIADNASEMDELIGKYSDMVRSFNEAQDAERRSGDMYVRLRKPFVIAYNEAWRVVVASIVGSV